MEESSFRKSCNDKEAFYERLTIILILPMKNTLPRFFIKKNINRITSDSDSNTDKCCHCLSYIQYDDSIRDI